MKKSKKSSSLCKVKIPPTDIDKYDLDGTIGVHWNNAPIDTRTIGTDGLGRGYCHGNMYFCGEGTGTGCGFGQGAGHAITTRGNRCSSPIISIPGDGAQAVYSKALHFF